MSVAYWESCILSNYLASLCNQSLPFLQGLLSDSWGRQCDWTPETSSVYSADISVPGCAPQSHMWIIPRWSLRRVAISGCCRVEQRVDRCIYTWRECTCCRVFSVCGATVKCVKEHKELNCVKKYKELTVVLDSECLTTQQCHCEVICYLHKSQMSLCSQQSRLRDCQAVCWTWCS